MTAERAASLVGVDQTRDLALGVFEAGPQGESLDAVGRYCLDPGGRSAEFALVVRETKRRLGLGELLLRTLIAAARARGLAEVWGQIAVDNAAMLQMVRQLGFTLSSEDGRSDRASLFLQPPSGRSASLQPSQYR
jgi:acetyltransferase